MFGLFRNLARLELKQAKALAGNQILEVAARAQTEAYELQALEATASITATALVLLYVANRMIGA